MHLLLFIQFHAVQFMWPILSSRHDIAEILLKVALNTINQVKSTYIVQGLVALT